MNTVLNETLSNFRNSRIGQLVCINDVDLLIDLEGKGSPNFTIKNKATYSQNMSNYIILTLDHIGTDDEYLLVCSSYEEACDVKLYHRPDFFVPDKRQVLQESSNDWLFDNEAYPQEIYNGDIVYKKKQFQNELFGNTCIVEWETKSQIVDYQLLVIETGYTHDGGGWVEFYQGRQIQEKDVAM